MDTELDEMGEVMTQADYDALTQALTKQSVSLVDEYTGELRDAYEVLGELAEAWKTMTANEQSALAQTFGSTRNQNVFISLMENFGEAEKAMKEMKTAEGELEEANNVYLESIQAHIQQLKNAFDTLLYSEGFTDFANQVIDFGTSIVKALGDVIDIINDLGGAKTVIAGLLAAFAINKWDAISTTFSKYLSVLKDIPMALSSVTSGSVSASNAITYLGGAATVAKTAFGVFAVALTAIVGIVNAVKKAHEDYVNSIYETGAEAKSSADNLIELSNKYSDAKESIKDNIDVSDDFITAQSNIKTALGITQGSIEELIKTYGDLDTAIKQLTLEQLKSDFEDVSQAAYTAIDEAMNNYGGLASRNVIGFYNGAEQSPITQYLQELGYAISDVDYDYGGTRTFTIEMPNIKISDSVEDYPKLLENLEYANRIKSDLIAYYQENNISLDELYATDEWQILSEYSSNIEDNVRTASQKVEDSNALLAQIEFLISDFNPDSLEDYEAQRDSFIEHLESSVDWKPVYEGGKSAEDYFLELISSNNQWSQFEIELQQMITDAAEAEKKSQQLADIRARILNRFYDSGDWKSVSEARNAVAQLTDDELLAISQLLDNEAATDGLIEGFENFAELYSHIPEVTAEAEEAAESVSQLYTKAQAILSKGYDNFSDLIGDTSDGSLSSSIDAYQAKIKSLRSALDDLDAGKMDGTALVDFAQSFPELEPYINDTELLREKILELIEATGLDMDEFLGYIIDGTPEAADQLNILKNLLLDIADVSVAPEEYKQLLGILDGFGPASERAAKALSQLNNSLQQGSYGSGMEARSDNFLKMLEEYQKGEIGDSDFRAYAEYFGIDLVDHIDENGQKIYKTYEQIGEEIERVGRYAGAYWDSENSKWAADADTGMKRWLDDLSTMENDLISFDNETKSLSFDPELLFNSDKLDEVAQSLGITSEFFIDLLNNFRKFSLDIGDYTNEELENALKSADLYDGTILDTNKIEEALTDLGYGSDVIQEIIDRAKQLSDTDIELEFSEKSLDNANEAFAELWGKIYGMQQAGIGEEEQVQNVVSMLEGLSPEIQAEVIAKLKDDPVYGSLGEQAEEAIGEQTVKTDAENMEEALVTGGEAVAEDVKDALDEGGDSLAQKIRDALDGKGIDSESLDPNSISSETQRNEQQLEREFQKQQDAIEAAAKRKDIAESLSIDAVKDEQKDIRAIAQPVKSFISEVIDAVTDVVVDAIENPAQDARTMVEQKTGDNVPTDLSAGNNFGGWKLYDESNPDTWPIAEQAKEATEDGIESATPEPVDVPVDLEPADDELAVLKERVNEKYPDGFPIRSNFEINEEPDKVTIRQAEPDEIIREENEVILRVAGEDEIIQEGENAIDEVNDYAEDNPVQITAEMSIADDSLDAPGVDISDAEIPVDNTSALEKIQECADSFTSFADNLQSDYVEVGVSVDDEEGLTTGRFLATVRALVEDPSNMIEVPLDADVAGLIQSIINGDTQIEGWTQEMSEAVVNAFPDQLSMPEVDTTSLDNATTSAQNLANAEQDIANTAIDESGDISQIETVGSSAETSAGQVGGLVVSEGEVSSVGIDTSSQVVQLSNLGTAADSAAQAFGRAVSAIQTYNNTPVASKSVSVPQAAATGTKSAKGGLTLLGDEYAADGSARPELVVSNGYTYLAGLNGPTFANLNKGDVVYPYKETKKILANNKFQGSLSGRIPAFAYPVDTSDGKRVASTSLSNPLWGDSKGSSNAATYYDNSTTYNIDVDSSATSDISTFTQLVNSASFKEFVDNFLNGTEKLQEAFDNLADGNDTGEIFDELYEYFTDDAEALEILGERYDFTTDKVKALNDLLQSRVLDNFNAQFGNLSTEQDIQALQDYMATILEMGRVTETIVNLDTFSDKMNNLYSAMKESVDATGLTADSIAELQERYKNLEGFDEAALFERTANGIHLNTTALRELESAYEDSYRQKIKKQLSDLKSEYKKLATEIENCADETEAATLAAKQNELARQIDDVETLSSQYAGLTSAFEKWKQAQSMGEEGDMYDDLVGSLEHIKELYEEGLVGTNEFRAAVQLMTNQDLSGWSAYEIAEEFQRKLPTVEKFFQEGQAGAENMLKAINALNAEWAYQDGSGWHFDFDTDTVADMLGINVELVEATLRKLSDYGFDIDLGVDTTEAEEYISEEHDSSGTVYLDVDTTNVDKTADYYARNPMIRQVILETVEDDSSGSSSTASPGESAAEGKSFAGGSGSALIGELGPELLVY